LGLPAKQDSGILTKSFLCQSHSWKLWFYFPRRRFRGANRFQLANDVTGRRRKPAALARDDAGIARQRKIRDVEHDKALAFRGLQRLRHRARERVGLPQYIELKRDGRTFEHALGRRKIAGDEKSVEPAVRAGRMRRLDPGILQEITHAHPLPLRK